MTDDGYVFSPYDVLKDLGNGYIVPHGDHYHFIPKSDLSASEIAIADSVLRSGKTHSALAGSQSTGHSNKNRQEGSQVGGGIQRMMVMSSPLNPSSQRMTLA